MRVIISGGTGVIGRVLVRDLAAEGHEVIVLSRDPDAVSDFPEQVRVEKWDAHSTDGWGHLVDGAGAVVNLAGESISGGALLPKRWTDARKQRIRDSRVNAGKAIVLAVEAAQHKPGVVIQASAVGYYGSRGDEQLSEDANAGHDFLAKTTAEWEQSTEALDTMGVRRCVIRIGVVLTTKGGALPSMMLPFKLFVGGPLGHGKQWVPWIHIDDVSGAIRYLIENEDTSGIYNLTAPNPLQNRDFAKQLGAAMRRPSFVPMPSFVFKTMFGEVATIVLDGQRAVPQRLQEANYEFKFPDAQSALNHLLKQRA
ncbi:MAG: TIGR01777 family protein [Chloroflexi bacterium]|nr:MAG: TIGR01777 family protein [Phototrophicales bacterium]RMF82581.1 MAG: TIGR01777 family protein [Chloroflexota bacterium]